MHEALMALATASAMAWVYLLFLRHDFWRADQRLPVVPKTPQRWPGVVALVPARNEEASVAACLTGIATQDYEGTLSVVLIDDSSTDATTDVAMHTAEQLGTAHPVRIVRAPALPAGWVGKLWALQHGISTLPDGQDEPEWLWFTDADVVHAPGVLSRLVAHARQDDLALVSLMVKLACRSRWERLLVPAFIFYFQMLYPFRAVNDRESSVAGAAGGCLIVKRCILEDVGGLSAIKDRLIDDCALAGIVKRQGHGIWLGLAQNSRSLRRYRELGDFWQMVVRSAFVQLQHSTTLLLASVVGMSVTFLAAPAVAMTYPLHENLAAAGVAAGSWAAMTFAYAPSVRRQDLGRAWTLTLPAASLLYLAMTVHSALQHWSGTGSHWKNRTYVPK